MQIENMDQMAMFAGKKDKLCRKSEKAIMHTRSGPPPTLLYTKRSDAHELLVQSITLDLKEATRLLVSKKSVLPSKF